MTRSAMKALGVPVPSGFVRGAASSSRYQRTGPGGCVIGPSEMPGSCFSAARKGSAPSIHLNLA